MPDHASRPDAGSVRLTIRAPVFPTEDPALVRQAVARIFPDAVFDEVPADTKEVRATGANISVMRGLLMKAHIRDSARARFIKSIIGRSISFSISKQAASAGKFTFALADVALGSIDVVIECEDPVAFVDDLTWIEHDAPVRGARARGKPRVISRKLDKDQIKSIREQEKEVAEEDWDADIDDDLDGEGNEEEEEKEGKGKGKGDKDKNGKKEAARK
jgi:predicted RNA binding protein with dsRBD fold (UPF0201 family)